jgi:chorismate mutase
MAIVALSLFACPKILCYPIIVAMSRLQHRRVEREKATRAHKKKSTAVGTVHVYLRECYFMRPAHKKNITVGTVQECTRLLIHGAHTKKQKQ